MKVLNDEDLINTVLLLNKAIRQMADAAGAGACCGVDVGGDVSHTASTIIARYDKLTEQNKMLREALVRVSEWDNMSLDFRVNNGSKGEQRAIEKIALDALEATK